MVVEIRKCGISTMQAHCLTSSSAANMERIPDTSSFSSSLWWLSDWELGCLIIYYSNHQIACFHKDSVRCQLLFNEKITSLTGEIQGGSGSQTCLGKSIQRLSAEVFFLQGKKEGLADGYIFDNHKSDHLLKTTKTWSLAEYCGRNLTCCLLIHEKFPGTPFNATPEIRPQF